MNPKVKIINFTAEWCDLCEDELKPTLEELLERHKSWDIETLSEEDFSDEDLDEKKILAFPTSFIYVGSEMTKVVGMVDADDFEEVVETLSNGEDWEGSE